MRSSQGSVSVLQAQQRTSSIHDDYRTNAYASARPPSASRRPPSATKTRLPDFPSKSRAEDGYRPGSIAAGLGGGSYAQTSYAHEYARSQAAGGVSGTPPSASSAASAARATSVPRAPHRTVATGGTPGAPTSTAGIAAGALGSAGSHAVRAHARPAGSATIAPGSILESLKTPSVTSGIIASLAQRTNSNSGLDYSNLSSGAGPVPGNLRLKRLNGEPSSGAPSPHTPQPSPLSPHSSTQQPSQQYQHQQHLSQQAHHAAHLTAAQEQLKAVYLGSSTAAGGGSAAAANLAAARRTSMDRTRMVSVPSGSAAVAAAAVGGNAGSVGTQSLPSGSYQEQYYQSVQQQHSQRGSGGGAVTASQYAQQYGTAAASTTVFIPYSSQQGSVSSVAPNASNGFYGSTAQAAPSASTGYGSTVPTAAAYVSSYDRQYSSGSLSQRGAMPGSSANGSAGTIPTARANSPAPSAGRLDTSLSYPSAPTSSAPLPYPAPSAASATAAPISYPSSRVDAPLPYPVAAAPAPAAYPSAPASYDQASRVMQRNTSSTSRYSAASSASGTMAAPGTAADGASRRAPASSDDQRRWAGQDLLGPPALSPVPSPKATAPPSAPVPNGFSVAADFSSPPAAAAAVGLDGGRSSHNSTASHGSSGMGAGSGKPMTSSSTAATAGLASSATTSRTTSGASQRSDLPTHPHSAHSAHSVGAAAATPRAPASPRIPAASLAPSPAAPAAVSGDGASLVAVAPPPPLPDLPLLVTPADAVAGRGCVGLQNLGNTCFMNSILQSLAAVPELVQHFNSPPDRAWSSKAQVAPAYSGLVRDMLRGAPGSVVQPGTFLRKLAKHDGRWGDGRQQDSQELLNSLLEVLQAECNRIPAKPAYRELAGKGPEEAQAGEALAYARTWHDSVVDDIFGGLLQSTIQCRECGHLSHTFEPFLGLALPIPSAAGATGSGPGGAVSVADCLRAFVEREELSGEDSVKCAGCKRCTPHGKRLQVYRPPRVLVLTLKRFSQRASSPTAGVGGYFSRLRGGGAAASKNNTPVCLDPEPLDLVPYCNPAGLRGLTLRGRQVAPQYGLVAVSHHSGSLEGGHYTASARSPLDGAWYNFNDSCVRREAGRPGGASSSAYVLFYRLATLPASSL